MLPGQHARLENLTEDGRFVTSETFLVAGQTVTHTAGESAKGLMAGWVQLRNSQPELLAGLLVWQTPTSSIDSILWGWQQREEASKREQQIRLVDCLKKCWTETAQAVNWATQTVQCAIGPGCTPLTQVTDTGFSVPGKASARQLHQKLKATMLTKARQEGASMSYRYGPRELAMTAQAIHNKFVEMNKCSQTVLAESRACGWLHYRPKTKTGKLELSSSQAWAKVLTEGSSRMGPEFRVNRDSWVVDGQPEPRKETDDVAPRKEVLAVSHWEELDETALVLDAEPEMDEIERVRLQAALLHPSVRSEIEHELAALALCTSQKISRKATTPAVPKATRRERESSQMARDA